MQVPLFMILCSFQYFHEWLILLQYLSLYSPQCQVLLISCQVCPFNVYHPLLLIYYDFCLKYLRFHYTFIGITHLKFQLFLFQKCLQLFNVCLKMWQLLEKYSFSLLQHSLVQEPRLYLNYCYDYFKYCTVKADSHAIQSLILNA